MQCYTMLCTSLRLKHQLETKAPACIMKSAARLHAVQGKILCSGTARENGKALSTSVLTGVNQPVMHMYTVLVVATVMHISCA